MKQLSRCDLALLRIIVKSRLKRLDDFGDCAEIERSRQRLQRILDALSEED